MTNGYRWFNPAAFALPPPGSFGSSKRNQFYGPGKGAVNFSVLKTTPMTDRLTTQLRIEIFNVFNTLNLSEPDGCLCSGDSMGLIFGSFTGGSNPGIGFGEPINVQVAFKFIW